MLDVRQNHDRAAKTLDGFLKWVECTSGVDTSGLRRPSFQFGNTYPLRGVLSESGEVITLATGLFSFAGHSRKTVSSLFTEYFRKANGLATDPPSWRNTLAFDAIEAGVCLFAGHAYEASGWFEPPSTADLKTISLMGNGSGTAVLTAVRKVLEHIEKEREAGKETDLAGLYGLFEGDQRSLGRALVTMLFIGHDLDMGKTLDAIFTLSTAELLGRILNIGDITEFRCTVRGLESSEQLNTPEEVRSLLLGELQGELHEAGFSSSIPPSDEAVYRAAKR